MGGRNVRPKRLIFFEKKNNIFNRFVEALSWVYVYINRSIFLKTRFKFMHDYYVLYEHLLDIY